MKQEKLESWSLGKNNTKHIPRGGEILKAIGTEMLFIDFSQDKETGEWSTKDPLPVFIESIADYEPMTGTYSITWRSKEGGTKEERITPEGFSFNNPEEDGWMHRFVTYSLHFKMMEEEMYYQRLRSKYNTSEGVLGIDPIMVIQKGRQKESLGYHNYIAAVIDSDVPGGVGMGILSFRISEFTKVDKRARSWSFGLRDSDGFYFNVPKYIQTEEDGWICKGLTIDGKLIGDLKIMDIEDPKA